MNVYKIKVQITNDDDLHRLRLFRKKINELKKEEIAKITGEKKEETSRSIYLLCGHNRGELNDLLALFFKTPFEINCYHYGAEFGVTRCYHCNELILFERIDSDDYITINGDYFCCGDCVVEEGLYECNRCGSWVHEDDASITPDGAIYCDDECAYNDGWGRCTHCEEWTSTDELTDVDDDDSVCGDCLTSHYAFCENCHTWYDEGDGMYDDDAGVFYCDDCYENACTTHTRRLSYHAVKTWDDFKTSAEDKSVLFGFELETICDSSGDIDFIIDGVNRILEKNDMKNLFYYEYDSSLGSAGIEIISQPISSDFFNAHRGAFVEVLDYLQKNGVTSHDARCCGLHIHIDRTALTDGDQNKMLSLFIKHQHDLSNFSRRKNYDYCHFWNIENSTLEYIKELDKGRFDRYHAINFTNEKTVEIRLWRGTINPVTFLATIDATLNLIAGVKNSTLDVEKSRLLDFLAFPNRTPELTEYLIKRGLL